MNAILREAGAATRRRGRLVELRYEAPGFGTGSILLENGLLVWHELPREPVAARMSLCSSEQANGARALEHKHGEAVVRRLGAFFRGEPVELGDVELDRSGLTGFGLALHDALRSIPRGELVTYGELAALAGRPGAARAAGTFCARNPFPVLVPCHRVVAAGGIGGYGSLGLEYKRRMLALEGITA